MARETLTQIMSDAPKAPNSTKPRFVAHNTAKYIREDGATCVRLHHTDVIAERAGIVTLDSGGWKTVTTKARLNTFGPVTWWQSRGEWFATDSSGAEITFFDGIKFRDGKCINPEPESEKTGRAMLAKKINKFARQLLDKEKWPDLPTPNSGDCWFCSMFDRALDQAGRTADNNHLMSHIEEGYIHGSLIVNAMRWAGYDDRSIGLHYQMDLRDSIARTLRRYLRRRLGLST